MAWAIRWIILIQLLFGNIVFWVHLFNRINSTGLLRKKIKVIEKLIVFLCFLVPGLVLWIDRVWFYDFLSGTTVSLPSNLFAAPPLTVFFAVGSCAAFLWLAPSWLIARYRLKIPPKALLQTSVGRKDLRSDHGNDIFAKKWVRALGCLPWNQLHIIETSSHEVRVEKLSANHDGLQIAHLSDVHLTGFMHFGFYREAVERLMDTKPDIVVLSGDLIDYERCLHQVQPLLEPVKSKLGCYFVLGNHDRRLKNVDRLRAMLGELGWHDLGARSKTVEHVGEELFFVGNERPWFDNPARSQNERETSNERLHASLRIGVSHSPDQIQWARRLKLDLLFCGHTHGGQVRLPWIGPIVAPSRFGSRYASGWFDCSPTLMHVSRGLSGTHPLRIGCTPEVSSIVLRK